MRIWLLIGLLASYLSAQERPMFVNFDPNSKPVYKRELVQLSQQSLPPIAYIDKKIYLASSYKHLDDLINALEEKIELTSENALLRYYLGGVNGIKALSVYRLFAIPYVRSMLNNFNRSLALDPNYTPALEAYIEALCLVPAIIGGSIQKANLLSDKLISLSLVEGYFSKGFIAKHLGNKEESQMAYGYAFNKLEEMDFCQGDKKAFFETKSLNFSYKIAEISAHYNMKPEIGLCAIDYFIEQNSPLYNIPLEWAYYRKAQLQLNLNKKVEANESLAKALLINPSFEHAKQLIIP